MYLIFSIEISNLHGICGSMWAIELLWKLNKLRDIEKMFKTSQVL